MDIFLNDKVLTKDWKVGVVRFMGKVVGKPDDYYGIVLTDEKGKNNGTFKKIPYFSTKSKNGLFIKYNHIQRLQSDAKSFPCVIGSRVYVKKLKSFGNVVYIGIPKDEKKVKLGIQLEKSTGDSNGTYKDGIQYFNTKRRYGYFCDINDLKPDTIKSCKKIIKRRLKNDEIACRSDDEKKENKESQPIQFERIRCGDKVIYTETFYDMNTTIEDIQGVGLVSKLESRKGYHSEEHYVTVKQIWPESNSNVSIKNEKIDHVMKTSKSTETVLKWNDVIHISDTDNYAIVKSIQSNEITIYTVPKGMIPSVWRTLKSLQSEYGAKEIFEHFVKKEVSLDALKYKIMTADSYANEVKPMVDAYDKQQREFEEKQREEQLLKWNNNEWKHGNTTNIQYLKEDNAYILKCRFGANGTMALRHSVPLRTKGVFRWNIVVKHHASYSPVFFGVTQDLNEHDDDYDLFCGKQLSKTVTETEMSWVDEGYDDSGHFWSFESGGCPQSYTVEKTKHWYPFKDLYGVFSTKHHVFDGKSEREYEANWHKHDMEDGDEYMFEINNNDGKKCTMNVCINNKLQHTFELRGHSIWPIISFLAETSSQENCFLFSLL